MAALQVTDRAASDGMQSVAFTQTVEGLPIVDSSLQAHLDDDGRLLAITGGLLPEPSSRHRPSGGPRRGPRRGGRGSGGCGRRATTERLVAYTAGDELRLAWRVKVNASSTGRFDTLVDAATGEVVRRANLVKFAGAAALFPNFPGAGSAARPPRRRSRGYLAPGATRLIGPNAHAFVDRDDVVPGPSFNVFAPPAATRRAPSSGADFVYPVRGVS